MAKPRRLHQLARELGIEAQSIIQRCRAEGRTIRNHQHELTPELERDIRGWFRHDNPDAEHAP